jgi:hypothetical protein
LSRHHYCLTKRSNCFRACSTKLLLQLEDFISHGK